MNIKNLELLADYLEKLPSDYDKFEMRDWFNDGHFDLFPDDVVEDYNDCGFAACAVGHCVFVDGLPKPNKNESWGRYAVRIFDIELGGEHFDWCFSSHWFDFDNTPLGAAKRIRYLIANPDLDDWDLRIDSDAAELYS